MALDDDRAMVRLRWNVGRSTVQKYGAVCVRRGCVVEAKSRAQQRTAESSGRGSWLGSHETGRNDRSDLPPREGARGRSGHCEGRDALAV